MNSFITVLLYELRVGFRKKGFLVTNLITCLLIIGGITIVSRFILPDETSAEDSGSQSVEDVEASDDKPLSAYGFANLPDDDIVASYLKSQGAKPYSDEKVMEKDIKSEKIRVGAVFSKDGSISIVSKSEGFLSGKESFFENHINEGFKEKIAKEYNIDKGLLQDKVFSYKTLGSVSAGSSALAKIWNFLLYFMILMFGNIVSMAVAREKDNRTMEILITSAKPSSLINGKVIANCILGFGSMVVYALMVVLGYTVNKSVLKPIWGQLSQYLKMDGYMIVVMALFTIIAYLMYMYMFAALGAMVSKVEDVGSSTFPIVLIFIIGFVASTNTEPTSVIGKIVSYVPFWSVMAMPNRMMSSDTPVSEVYISLAIAVATTLILAYGAVKIYRAGTLNYGKKLSLFKAFKR